MSFNRSEHADHEGENAQRQTPAVPKKDGLPKKRR
jgi:hypothetical protein